MTEQSKAENHAFDQLFAAGREQIPQPTEEFLARLSLDAKLALPQETPASAPKSHSVFRQWHQKLFAASGLATAALAGIWLGFSNPTGLDGFFTEDSTLTLAELMPAANLGVIE